MQRETHVAAVFSENAYHQAVLRTLEDLCDSEVVVSPLSSGHSLTAEGQIELLHNDPALVTSLRSAPHHFCTTDNCVRVFVRGQQQ